MDGPLEFLGMTKLRKAPNCSAVNLLCILLAAAVGCLLRALSGREPPHIVSRTAARLEHVRDSVVSMAVCRKWHNLLVLATR